MSVRNAPFQILRLLATTLTAAAASAVFAQEEPQPQLRIVRATTPPRIDGVIDDPVWNTAASINDFHQTRPVDRGEPSEPTQIRLLYDDEYLYIAGLMYDSEPERISANVMTHGSGLGQDDRIAIVIDPFNAGRNGYRFETNANGIRHEALYTNVTSFQSEWTVIWDTASTVDADGWYFEMAIPFKSLPFNPNIDTWGINFGRAIRRRGEEIVWVSRNRSYNPSIVGQVTGFEGINQGVGLDIVPSATANRRRTFGPAASNADVEPSLDVFYRVTSSLNASLTVNTDFSATEVDDRQVNLTRFNLFFPEKRDFFLNDADLFEFGRIGASENQAASGAGRQSARPFFSRRLGLSASGQEVDIEYGGKLSGRVGRFSIGALTLRQDQFADVDASDVFVGRVQADVLRESSVGLIMTDGDPASNLGNSVAGADFLYRNTRLPGGRLLEAQAWWQQSDTDGVSGNDAAWGVGVNIPSAAGIRGGVALQELEANFNPALGFVDRRGVRDLKADIGFTRFIDTGYLQSAFGGIDLQRIERVEGGVQSEVIVGRLLELQSRSRDNFSLKYVRNREVVRTPFVIYRDTTDDPLTAPPREVTIAAGDYEFDDFGFDFSTGNQRRLAGGLEVRSGDFYDGQRDRIAADLTWRPSAQFNMRIRYDWNDIELPGDTFTTRVAQLRAEYVFSLRLSWSNLIQYDNVSEVLGFNSRLRWVPRAGREGFIVLNHNIQDANKDNRFESALSDVSIKFSYTFRF